MVHLRNLSRVLLHLVLLRVHLNFVALVRVLLELVHLKVLLDLVLLMELLNLVSLKVILDFFPLTLRSCTSCYTYFSVLFFSSTDSTS